MSILICCIELCCSIEWLFARKQILNHQADNCNKQTSIQVYPIFPSTHVSTRYNFLAWVAIKNMFVLWIMFYWKIFFRRSIIPSQAFVFLAVDYLEDWRMNLKQTFVEQNTCNTRKLNTSFEALYWQKLC